MDKVNSLKILERRTSSNISNIIGWITVVVMGLAAIVMFLTWLK